MPDQPLDPSLENPSALSGSSPAGEEGVWRSSETGRLAEQRALDARAALTSPPPGIAAGPVLTEWAGPQEQAAALFAMGEHKRAIDVLVGHLNHTAGNAPRAFWFMLMDAYEALGQQEAFEKSAYFFADFFKTSPPSWEGAALAPSTTGPVGRNVLVLDGSPSQAHPDKLKDFVAAAREAGRAKLDMSRTRLDDDHVQRTDDLRSLLDLMRRLRRRQVKVVLMGETPTVEILRQVIQHDVPVPSQVLYWDLLLEFMQWRGQEQQYEDLAIRFAARFGRSAPGFEPTGVVAEAPTETAPMEPASGHVPPAVLDDTAMEAWCQGLETSLPAPGEVERLDFRRVRHISFSAAGVFADRLRQWDLPNTSWVVAQPSELVWTLFDITGVAGQVSLEPRRR